MSIAKMLGLPFGVKPTPPGLHHYTREAQDTVSRFHLRVDAGGDGLLLANAAAMARLTPPGVVIAKGLLDGEDLPAIVRRLKILFRGASTERIAADVTEVKSLIARMEAPAGGYPILNLADPAFSPKSMPLGRPLSADVPLGPPFQTALILERLWQIGVPHVTLLISDGVDAAQLVRAVERAGDLGMITGVRGRGAELAEGSRIADLAAAGLDHLDVCCFSNRDEVHDFLAGPGDSKKTTKSLAMAVRHGVCPVAQIAILHSTLATFDTTLESLVRHGVVNVGVFAISTDAVGSSGDPLTATELPPVARQVEEIAERLGVRLLWQPTSRFDAARPLGEQACRGPRCSGDTSIRVEPDGRVFPPRGPYRAAGNLFDDDWETIEASEAYANYRRRIESDTHCDTCPGLSICSADCPRDPAGWAEPE
jgi:radical SAM protein with 4Fe4S-binding SPASM domain